MKYEIIHISMNDDIFIGYTVLADQNSFDHYKSLGSGKAGPFGVSFIPYDRNFIEGNYQFIPKEDLCFEAEEPESQVLYFFINNMQKVNVLNYNEWFDSERTKLLANRQNIKRIKELAGIK